MSTASRSGSRDLLTAALLDARNCAARGGDALLHHVPDTGDLVTGRIVDDFVERTSDALRALAQSLGESLDSLQPTSSLMSSDPLDSPGSLGTAHLGREDRR